MASGMTDPPCPDAGGLAERCGKVHWRETRGPDAAMRSSGLHLANHAELVKEYGPRCSGVAAANRCKQSYASTETESCQGCRASLHDRFGRGAHRWACPALGAISGRVGEPAGAALNPVAHLALMFASECFRKSDCLQESWRG